MPVLTCTPRSLPKAIIEREIAAGRATYVTLSVLTARKWPSGGVKLTVGFLDAPPTDLRKRVIEHMNAWSKTANVLFTESDVDPQVRIARIVGGPDGGYWSYLGTDILLIDKDQPTMNLENFSMAMPDSEFRRVVRHETGHTLGFPHEHMRRDLVNLIDRDKAIAYYGATQGWSPADVEAQVLTPIEDSSILGTPRNDTNSIMCYEIPGEITRNGHPIIGGVDIDDLDYEFAASVYPR